MLDEPTTGLDVSTQRHVLETVRKLCASYGVAGVYVSHDLAVVSGLATQVAVMYAGRIIELGETRPVFSHPPIPIRGACSRPRHRLSAPKCSSESTGIAAAGATSAGLLVRPALRLRRRAVPGEAGSGHPSERPRSLPPSDRNPVRRARPAVIEALAAEPGTPPSFAELRLPTGQRSAARHRPSISPERCVAVVGESGSGKTTLARCIVGLHSNWTGEMLFEGEAAAAGSCKRPKEVLQSGPVHLPESLHLA